MSLPRIAVTMGDPAGIGPEVCLQLLSRPEIAEICSPVVFGDAGVLRRVAEHCELPLPEHVLTSRAELTAVSQPAVYDLDAIDADTVESGKVSAATGQASYKYIHAAIESALAGKVDAVSTRPIHKEAINAAGIPYPGHTEIFTAETGAERSCMMLTSSEITCSFVTGHIGYRDVPGKLSIERILDTVELSDEAMQQIRGRRPKLLICGLNPHAGEGGLFGDREEEKFIIPAVEEARSRGIDISGPLPPDTVFLPWRRREIDCFVCMYHDQGHIPLKALAFDTAVNITLGLPIIRTSVDHGTAFDIAWQKKADVTSLSEAVRLAAQLAQAKVLTAGTDL